MATKKKAKRAKKAAKRRTRVAAKRKAPRRSKKVAKKRTQKPPKRKSPPKAKKTASKRGRGRRLDQAELQRRLDVLKRIAAGEINNREAAKELGMAYGSWMVWKSNQKKGRAKRKNVGRPKKAARRKAPKRAKRTARSGGFAFRYESMEELEQWVNFLRYLDDRGLEVPFSIEKGQVMVG